MAEDSIGELQDKKKKQTGIHILLLLKIHRLCLLAESRVHPSSLAPSLCPTAAKLRGTLLSAGVSLSSSLSPPLISHPYPLGVDPGI